MDTKPRKIFILVNELLRGGAQRIILDLVKNGGASGEVYTVVRLKSYANFTNPQTLDSEVTDLGVRVISLEGRRKISFHEIHGLYKLLRDERPDVLHTYLPYAGIVGRVVGRIAGVHTVISTQCNLPVAYRRFTYNLDRITLPLAKAWTGATEGIEVSYGGSYQYFSDDLWKKGRRHFTVVAGVDLPIFDARVAKANRGHIRKSLGYGESEVLVMMIARLISWKGHEDLVNAFAELPSNMHLVLIGWGPLEGQLRAQAEALGISHRVQFLGARNDIPELLAVADIYVQAHGHAPDGKIWEGPNTSQMEACAARVPSVSTAVPRIETLIEDGITGVLAEPDNAKSIAEAILTIHNDPEAAQKMVVAARTRVEERYSIATMVKTYEELYAASDTV